MGFKGAKVHIVVSSISPLEDTPPQKNTHKNFQSKYLFMYNSGDCKRSFWICSWNCHMTTVKNMRSNLTQEEYELYEFPICLHFSSMRMHLVYHCHFYTAVLLEELYNLLEIFKMQIFRSNWYSKKCWLSIATSKPPKNVAMKNNHLFSSQICSWNMIS